MIKKFMSPTTARQSSRARNPKSGAVKSVASKAMAGKIRHASTCRLEARIPAELYEVMERAAALRGLTMTAYVTATMGHDARRTIEETSIIKLSQDDQIAFAKALSDPPRPNAKLVAAARRHAALIR